MKTMALRLPYKPSLFELLFPPSEFHHVLSVYFFHFERILYRKTGY